MITIRMRAPAYIRERREANPTWVRRHRRSLSANPQYRRRVKVRHVLAKLALEQREALKRKKEALDREQQQKQSFAAKLFDPIKKTLRGLFGRRGQK